MLLLSRCDEDGSMMKYEDILREGGGSLKEFDWIISE